MDSHADTKTQVFFEISNAANKADNLNDLYKVIHTCLGKILNVDNFFIALYNDVKDSITFPYYVDQVDEHFEEIFDISKKQSLTVKVIKQAHALMVSEGELSKMVTENSDQIIGTPSKIWIGAPLKIKDKAFGALVLQNYKSADTYKKSDLDILSSASGFVALSIDRKLAEEKIRQNEILTQTLFRISNAINTTENLDDLYQSIYHSLNQLIDLPNFFIAIVNKEEKRLTFPFFVDEHDTQKVITRGLEKYEDSTSNTSQIIFSKKPLFLSSEMLQANLKQKKTIGTNSKVWLGVPLIVRDDVIGVMVVQHYTDPEHFTKKDIELLTSVSDQIATAIDRKKEEQARKKSERLTSTLFSISNAVNTTDRLPALFNTIYEALNVLIDLPNFFICIYQKKTNSMFFPFYIDEYDSEETISFTIDNIDEEASMTTDVINSKKPIFLTKDKLIQRKKEKKIVGKVPVIWLGVPLMIRGEVIGIMAAQHYTDPEYFSAKDLDLFIAVSEQVALAIDRRQSQEIIIEREKQIIELSRQTQELSLVAASIISMKDDKRIFNHISNAIVENSDFQKLIISYFTNKPPYRKILGYQGINQQDIKKTKRISVAKNHFDTIFSIGEKIGNFTCYLPHTKNHILSKDLLSIFTRKHVTRNRSAWHPNDILFIPMNDSDGNMMGVISAGNSKSGNMPTNETVRPLEIFSSLISQIIIVRRIQNELKDHKENLEKLVDGRTKELTTEIKERIEIEKMLKKAKIDAEAAAQAKIEFLANMSHEIRTPINGIMGMAEIALEKDLDEDLKQIFTTIDSEADQLLGIINEILDFSKIEAGKLSIEQISFDLRRTFEKTCSSLAMGIADEEIEFISFLAPDVPTYLIGDPGRLRQILVNLISNAIKFTHKGEIFIKGEVISELGNTIELRFLVKDTGIGIAKEKQGSIFESFNQADGSTTREYGGTGLGTTISKQIVELMGGNIGLESEKDKGSLFWLTAKFTKQKNTMDKIPTKSLCDLESLKILVVDDNHTNQFVFKEYLKSFGCISYFAEDGVKAMACIKEEHKQNQPFDVAITNLMLPEIDGFELARKIRTSNHSSTLPIIMLTSAGKLGDGSKCRIIGINAYLPKPVKKEELKTVIAAVLGKTQDENQVQEKLVTRHTIAEKLAGKINILLVEDYPTNQKIAIKHLTSVGYQVTLAVNGRQAVDLFKKKRFDLILMDIQMPEMDGYDATRRIREYEEKFADIKIKTNGKSVLPKPRAPIVAMTAHAIKGYKKKCLAAGMDDYITKPIKKQTFLQMVVKWTTSGVKKARLTHKKKIQLNNNEINEGPFDYEKALDEFEDDKAFLKEVIDEFLEHLSKQLSKISRAISNNNPDIVKKEAHAIKGGAANLTAYPLSKTAHELERIGKSGILDKSRIAFEDMNNEFKKLKEYLLTLDV